MAKSVVCDLLQIFKSSVSAVLPDNLIKKSFKYNPASQQLTIAGENVNLHRKNVYLIGTGKAVKNMAREVENLLSSKIKHGIISIPEGSMDDGVSNNNISYYEGAKNNLPDSNAENTAKIVRTLVTNLGNDDILLVLISGGGSALLPLPKSPISLDEKTALIKNLANAGADIKELNTVRKRLSDLKGGQLAIKAQPAHVISLILSDIVGDPLDLIASGPTTMNTDDPALAINIIKKYKLLDLPDSIKSVLNQTDSKTETKFPTKNVRNLIIGSNKISLAAASEEARKMNYFSIPLSDTVTGNVKDVASAYSKVTKLFCGYLKGKLSLDYLKQQIQFSKISGVDADTLKNLDISKNKDLCLVLGGEITVEVNGSGKGGRNQQLALEFSESIHNSKDDFGNFDIYFLSAGTDGIDGPTDAAGAIGYLNLIPDAKKENFDIPKYLAENDSYNFYKEFKNGTLHVITGHTNTNVMDIHIIIIRRN